MSLINFILAIALIGILLYLINRFVPMDPKVKQLLNIVVIVLLIIWVLSVTGFLARLDTVRVPSISK